MKSIKDRILIVENNPEISDFLANQALASTDYQVFQVADASSAINKAVQINPDLIISNLNLPGLSGKDLLIALSSHGITPPTIMLASAGHEADIIQAFRLGAADYITWPIRDTEVVLVVERLLKQVHDRRDHINLENRLQITNQQLQQRVKELTAIFSIGKAVTSITNHKILFDKILQISAQVSQSDLGWFLMRQEEKGKNFLLVSQYNLPDIFMSKMHKVWDDGISQLVAISGETLNISGEPIKRFKVKVLGESIIIVPIKIQRQVMGLLVLMRKRPDPFSQSEQRLLEAVTDYASISFVNARLFRSYEAREQALSSLINHSQLNEQINNELLFKTKNNLDNMLSDGQNAWKELQQSFESNDQETSKKHLESFDKFMHEFLNLSSLLHADPFSMKTNQNQKIDLVLMVNDLYERFQPIIQYHQLTIRKENLINSLNIAADPNHMYETLNGILTNAIQFCEGNGEIFIKINQDTGTKAILSISNTGKIPDHTKKQLLSIQNHFEKQDKIRFGGIGISLNLIQKIISQYGGRIWVEDLPEYGTTFHLTLLIAE
ncbi:MAG: response regulator [Anaerolineaceae bacterium]|nr:response regulator [Anaerolineaceae bacterium]